MNTYLAKVAFVARYSGHVPALNKALQDKKHLQVALVAAGIVLIGVTIYAIHQREKARKAADKKRGLN